MQLVNGSKVAIIGGGPAGSFAALNLLRFAAEAGRQLEIEIFEARDFGRPGPGGCNKCAGILSSKLVSNLKGLGIELPADLIQAELDAYILHLQENELFIQAPDPGRHIISVYRGVGPRLGTQPLPRSFDAWLLEQAQARGATLHHERVRMIKPGLHPAIILARRETEADLVIVATGINTQTPLDPAWGYRPPLTEVMAQDEILLPANVSSNHVHIFFEPPQDMIFGGIIPKGRYANISLLGRALPPNAIAEFLGGQNSSGLALKGLPVLCGCTPRVAISPAAGYYADRMVAVGDSAVTRLYKDGLGAAYATAESAARTAIELGVGKKDFAAGYRPTCRQIATDNRYGQLLFRFWSLTRRVPLLLEAWQHALIQEESLPPAQQIHRRVLWGLFTGDESYRQIFGLLASPPALWRMGQSLLSHRRSK